MSKEITDKEIEKAAKTWYLSPTTHLNSTIEEIFAAGVKWALSHIKDGKTQMTKEEAKISKTVILFFEGNRAPDFIETTSDKMLLDISYWLKRRRDKEGEIVSTAYIVESILDVAPIYEDIDREEEQYRKTLEDEKDRKEFEQLKLKFKGK